MNKLWIGVEPGQRVSRPFLAISYLSITVITISWNVLTRKLGADTQGRAYARTNFNQWPLNTHARTQNRVWTAHTGIRRCQS